MKEIVAESKVDLLEQLRSVDISVPSRANGRTKEDREKWSICRLLASLGQSSKLTYPLNLVKQERPDFSLQLPSTLIGIEHVDATIQDFEEDLNLWEKKGTAEVFDLTHYKYSEKLPKSKRKKIINEKVLSGPGWEGDEPERGTANVIVCAIKKKTALFQKYDCGFGDYWLLIYNGSPYSGVDVDTCIGYLQEYLKSYWDSDNGYERIYIEINSYNILEITVSTINKILIADLWH